MKHIKLTDHKHFLYVASRSMDKIIDNDNESQLYLNKEKTLCWLDEIRMNGFLFSLINPDVFALSIQQLMISSDINNKHKHYGGKLYNEISQFDWKCIEAASMCKVKFTQFTQMVELLKSEV